MARNLREEIEGIKHLAAACLEVSIQNPGYLRREMREIHKAAARALALYERATAPVMLREDAYRYVDTAVGINPCAACGRHELGEEKHPQFFKAGGAGYVYHLPCLATLLAGYEWVTVSRNPLRREFRKIADAGGGVF